MPVWSELLALSSGAWRLSVLALLVLATGCCGWPEGVTATSPSRISLRLYCGLVFSCQGSKIFLSRHGDIEESMLGVLGCRLTGLRLGSSEASRWRASAVALSWLPPSMVIGRPLCPLSLVLVQRMRIFILQAVVPKRRPFSSITVGSRSSIPSGSVPGDGVLGGGEMQWCGGQGVGPDCFLSFRSRVPSANWTNLVVIFLRDLPCSKKKKK
jgi:hypothetical protein